MPRSSERTPSRSRRRSARAHACRPPQPTYAAVVQAKSGMPSPFDSLDATGLEASTIASLKAERNAIHNKLTGPIDVVKPG